MAINKSQPIRFTPRGLTDAFDATDKFPGACQALTNLIFDQSNPELMISRPGVISLADLGAAGMNNPTFISIQATIGTRVYGMVATSTTAGKDEPFCYDVAASALVAIAGITANNVPDSPATSGDWVPPTLTIVGTMVLITHPGFDGNVANSRFFGCIDITTFAAPVWHSYNTATNALTGVPQAVANFNNRAYFAVGNELQYTDALTNPPTRTLATQGITVGDTTDINALAGLPIQTTSSGVIGALIAFKETQVWQITGDTVVSNLSLNYISLTIGTTMPRSVAQSPLGLYFGTSGGPYQIDVFGILRAVTNRMDKLDPDIVAPFQNATTPSRWAGAYASSVYRVCGHTIIRGVEQVNDYWFDERRRRWTGPHSFEYDCASALGGYFVLSSFNNNGLLIRSDPFQTPISVFTDLGAPTQGTLWTSSFPKTGDMCEKQVVESQIELSASGGAVTYYITAQDEQSNTLGTVTIAIAALGGLWGFTVWGDGHYWTTSVKVPHTVPIPWEAPLVFEKMQLLITAVASANLKIGTFYARYQKTGWMTQG
jgi:hypothetical protein